ncbi:cytidylate kinase family protein [Candidatus Micrarchaeota archaeon]|nr:cytidylate kinase family protein [Candidatus Micrarchaeota archaeon]
MIIAISGYSGSGKNTLGEKIAEKLGFRVVSPTFKDLAKKEGIPLLELQKRALSDESIDRMFDKLQKEEAEKGDCVFTTWLGPWMIETDFSIFILAPLEVRAKRIAKRDGMSFDEALRHVINRDLNNIQRYKKIYDIDISNLEGFDLAISSDTYSPEKMVEIVIKAIEKKGD